MNKLTFVPLNSCSDESASKKYKSTSTRFSTSKGQRAVRRNELTGELSERAGREISEKKSAVFLFIISSPPFHYSVISFATVVLPRTARIHIKKHHRATIVPNDKQWRIYLQCGYISTIIHYCKSIKSIIISI